MKRNCLAEQRFRDRWQKEKYFDD
uniref:Uncharacterized protein n=1 Tax=Heterorhabditis bacteriophora TaxID=37862 RepID=A0A1I7W6Y9_HETBA